MNKNLEHIIKEKLENYQVPFNEEHWNEFQQLRKKKLKLKKLKQFSVATAIILIITLMSINLFNDNNNFKIKSKTPISNNLKFNKIKKNNSKTKTENKTKISNLNKEHRNNTKEINKQINDTAKTEQNINNNQKKSDENYVNKNDSLEKNKIDLLKIKIIPSNIVLCQGESANFKIKGISSTQKNDIKILWNLSNGTIKSGEHISLNFKETGTFDLQLIIESNKKIIKKIIKNNFVKVNPKPKADFAYDIGDLTPFDPYVKMYNVSECNCTCTFIIENNILNDCEINYPFYNQGQFNVLFILTNEFSCSDTLSKIINIDKDVTLLAPNAFTPNNDGKNDFFMPELLKHKNIKFVLEIYDKNSKLVFKTNESSEQWNGALFNEGEILDAGLYFWQAVVYDKYNKTHKYTGKIRLLK